MVDVKKTYNHRIRRRGVEHHKKFAPDLWSLAVFHTPHPMYCPAGS
jgi:hypothetical protein